MKSRFQHESNPGYKPRPLVFAPLAWLKLQFFCHAGNTEVGGFGVSCRDDLLYIEDFITVCQDTSPFTVCFDDGAVSDLFDECVDAGIEPQRFARVWIHTHPGTSAEPSIIDEATFACVFGGCDWALMFILSRGNKTYARLSVRAGPGAEIELPVAVDWAAWPDAVADNGPSLDAEVMGWQEEYAANIHSSPGCLAVPRSDERGVQFLGGIPNLHQDDAWTEWENLLEERYEQQLAGV